MIDNFYNRLKEEIFVDHTNYFWKNGWENEGDRNCKSLSISNEKINNNLFLLYKHKSYDGESILIEGPNNFKITIKSSILDSYYGGGISKKLRIDIEYNSNLRIYYYIDNEYNNANESFIFDICEKIYELNVRLKTCMTLIPNDIFGVYNPDFIIPYYRDEQLKKIGI